MTVIEGEVMVRLQHFIKEVAYDLADQIIAEEMENLVKESDDEKVVEAAKVIHEHYRTP